MPSRWQVLLRASSAPKNGMGPRQVTPAQLHGLACALFEGVGAEHQGQRKPFAVSPLLAAPDRPGLDSGRQLGELWIGWLDDERVPEPAELVGRRIRLGAQFFTVVDVDGGNVPYAALRAHPAARRAELEFRSATYFSRSGRWLPLPDPALVYGGLARRWDTFAAQELEPQLVSELLAAVMISEHEVRSIPVDLGAGRRIGFTGRAVFGLDRDSAQGEVGVLFAALSRFAEAAGVGAQTTHGLGWVGVGLDGC